MRCPTPETIEALRAGTLNATLSVELSAHLSTCPLCLERERARAQGENTLAGVPPAPLERVPVAPPTRIGRYVVLGRLGEGGMGTVYAAYHPELDRQVALKVLRAEAASGDHVEALHARLMQEAQSMARLAHPNVVAVHDVGRDDGQVYIVMERVEGESLSERLARGAPSSDEARSILLQAGQGLAAAHRAKLIHRDFKPANVLLSTDGRVRVADFGIARASRPEAGVPAGPEVVLPGPIPRSSPSGFATSPSGQTPLSNELLATRPGIIAGTPLYMAPEQFEGQPADERSDQFSFCVTAYQTLYGQRPFDPMTPLATRYERPLEPPSRGEPRFVRAAILRGLSRDRANRFESMDALLRELGREPVTMERLAPWAALLVVLIGASVGFYRVTRPIPVPGCEGAERELSAQWSPASRAALTTSFESTGHASATQVANGVADTLDAFAASWATEAKRGCDEAKAAGASQRTGTLECLDRQRMQLAALLDVFGKPTAAMMDRAVFAASALVPPSRCEEPNILATLPRIPEKPELREEVERVRFELARALAFNLSGQPEDSATLLPKLRERATSLGFRPLEAEVALVQAETSAMAGDGATGSQYAHDAMQAALASGLELTAADALAMMAFFGGYSGKLEAADGWLEQSKALLEHAGGDPLIEAKIENSSSLLEELHGRQNQSLPHQERAWSLRAKTLGVRHPKTLAYMGNVATVYKLLCEDEKAKELLSVFDSPGDLQRSPAIYAEGLQRLAEVLIALNDTAEAARVIDMSVRATDRFAGVRLSERLSVQAKLLAMTGHCDEADVLGKRAVELSRSGGDDWVNYAYAQEYRVDLLITCGRAAEAQPLAEELVKRLAGQEGGDVSPILWLRLSRARLAAGQRERAYESLKTTRTLAETKCLRPETKADLDLTEAEILEALQQDAARVQTLKASVADQLKGRTWAGPYDARLSALSGVAAKH